MRVFTLFGEGTGENGAVTSPQGVVMENLLAVAEGERALTAGVAVIPPGARIPAEGMGEHDADEIACIISGTIAAGTATHMQTLGPGTVSFIPAGEAHWSRNEGDAPATIFWVLVKPNFPALGSGNGSNP